jgi:hypothetical protein
MGDVVCVNLPRGRGWRWGTLGGALLFLVCLLIGGGLEWEVRGKERDLLHLRVTEDESRRLVREDQRSALVAQGFALRDQYNQLSTYQFPPERVTVLIFGDRKGSEQIEGWVRPLWDRYQAKIDQRGVAVLSSVPALVRGMVRTIFRSQVKYSVLLDWKGNVSEAFGYQQGRANLIVIDRKGRIVLRLLGAADAASLERLYGQIDQLLREGGEG